ncbi:MAG: hypothetical protein RLY16_1543 [Bacteroidota bacterium]
MKNRRTLLYGLILLLTGSIYFAVQALQKKATPVVSFSGEWKAKESISMGGNIVCSYVEGDRMRSKTMKITEQPNFLTIETPNPAPNTPSAISQEKLSFDGKESQIAYDKENGKKFTVKLSTDRKTMTIQTTVHLMVATPYKVNVMKQAFFYITEVWKLSDDGKSITVQTNAKSNDFSKERSWQTVFERVH